MQPICVWIHPKSGTARVLAVTSTGQPILKARLHATPASRRAASALLQAIALWQGQVVHAALVVDASGPCFESNLYHDMFPDFGDGQTYTLEYVTAPAKRTRDAITGMGRFSDLRQVVIPDAR